MCIYTNEMSYILREREREGEKKSRGVLFSAGMFESIRWPSMYVLLCPNKLGSWLSALPWTPMHNSVFIACYIFSTRGAFVSVLVLLFNIDPWPYQALSFALTFFFTACLLLNLILLGVECLLGRFICYLHFSHV